MLEKKVLNNFRNRRVLVTGGTGLIGRQVVDILVGAGAQVNIVSLDKINVNKHARHIYGDLSSFEFCKKIAKRVDFAFHLAGIKGSIEVTKSKPASFFVPLLMMNTNILEACRVNGVKKVVYTSSIGAYSSASVFKEKNESEEFEGPPMDMYPGWAKRMAELQIKAYKTQYGLDSFAVVRPCNVYGPGDNFDPENAMVIPSLMSRIHNGEDPVVVWGDGSAIRDFAYSRDVAEGVILALHFGTKGGFVNLGSGKGVTIKKLVATMRTVVDFNFRFDSSKPAGFPKRVMDISLAREIIHYNPTTTLNEGLKETWNWYLKNTEEFLKRKNYFKSN
ncbi:MAG: NAD-dependent epimerase/dehydratase family protein [Candidatus Curtissbacteria bacterium]|nr:NAD-dependent epimerase/dehydratase family protein [Candidatus Curtissbacteria bacterium]